MKTEVAQLLMNRAIDGVATAAEREQLASAMRADPLLRQEFEELQAAHTATAGLFRQLQLPRDFSNRVMSRVQGHDVPSDEHLRLPAHRPLSDRKIRLARVQRNRVRMYAVVAGISAAASVLLIVGVFSGFFVRNGIGTVEYVPPEGPVADGRQGVPDEEGYNRTDPSTRPPDHSVEDAESDDTSTVNDGVIEDSTHRNHESTTDVKRETRPESQPEEGEASHKEGHDKDGHHHKEEVVEDPAPRPDPAPESEPREVVKQPEPEPEAEPQPEPAKDSVVEGEPESRPETEQPTEQPSEAPNEEPKETVAVEMPVIGKLSVLSGHIYRLSGEDWVKTEEGDVREGMQFKTSASGVVVMSFDSGVITLGGRTEARMDATDSFTLMDGEAAMERGGFARGRSLEMVLDHHRLSVTHGNVFVERNRRGFEVSKPFGSATITHDSLGSILLDEDSAYTAEVEFDDEAYGMPVAEDFLLLPDYSAETRARLVMQRIDQPLSVRDFGRDERAYVEDRVPKNLIELMVHPVTCDSIVDFMTDAVENTSLIGRDYPEMVDEVISAMLEFDDLHSPEDVAGFAGRAALVAESYDNWKDYFYSLLRPAAKKPAQTPSTSKEDPDCPAEANKLKRVEKQPAKRKVIKKSNPQNGDDDDDEEDKPSS